MAVILSIETSTSVCSAALHEKGKLVAYKELHSPHSAAAQLAVQIQELFNETKIARKQLAAVAVSAGPGSYTGLRIGISTAKGICYGLSLPLIAIDSLWVLASSIANPSMDLLCPMIDARRMEVYCCLLDTSLQPVEGTHARVIDQNSFSEQLSVHSVLFFGDGAMKCRETIKHPNAVFMENIYNSASAMGPLAYKYFLTQQFQNLELFEPNYLKDFVAKTKLV
jgi:tRNA threonylcarbamoyladenosine biosynthesis protein TsaB